MNDFVNIAIHALGVLVILYFLLTNGFYLFTTLIAFRLLRRHALRMSSVDLTELVSYAGAPPVTLIAPAFNEQAECVESMKALLAINYDEFEILFVNDGSTDDTLTRMRDAFNLVPAPRVPTSQLATAEVRGIYRSRNHPRLWLIDKVNGGKADSLNAGLNYARTPLFLGIDADTLLEPNGLLRSILPFLEDSRTIAVGGVLRVANDCRVEAGRVKDVRLPRKMIARFQVLEYLRAFLSGRLGWSALGGTLIVSGAYGLFKRSLVVEAGGYSTNTVGEDMELVVRLHHHCRKHSIPYRISFIPEPVAWTEVPEKIRHLGRQRDRWQRGLAETLLRHRDMMFRTRYGFVGMIAFPYYFFLEMLGPVIELIGYFLFVYLVVMGRFSQPYTVAFLMVAIVLGVALSISALALSEMTQRRYTRLRDLLRLFADGILENFGYRQLTSWFRLRGLISLLRRKKEWGSMERRGFHTESTS